MMPVGDRPPSRSEIDSSGTGAAQARPRSEARTSAKAAFGTTNEFFSNFASSLISSGYRRPGARTGRLHALLEPQQRDRSAVGQAQRDHPEDGALVGRGGRLPHLNLRV